MGERGARGPFAAQIFAEIPLAHKYQRRGLVVALECYIASSAASPSNAPPAALGTRQLGGGNRVPRWSPESRAASAAPRLYVVGASKLPAGLGAALARAGLERRDVEPSLPNWKPEPNDVLLLSEAKHLAHIERRLSEARRGLGAAQPPVVVLGDPMQLPFGAAAEVLVDWVLPMGSADDVARQVLKCINATLERKAASRGPRVPSVAVAGLAALDTDSSVQRASVEPPRSHSRGPGLPAFATHVSVEPRSGFSLSTMDALRFPQPPRLPTVAGQPMEVVTPVPSGSASAGSVVAGAPSLMPRDVKVAGSRWLLIDDDVNRAHAIASALERAGARVELCGQLPNARRLAAMRDLDACGVLLAESELGGMAALLQAFSSDARLRWARVVPVRWANVFDEASSRVDHEALKLLLLPHWQPEHDATAAWLSGQAVDCGVMGPAKFLRAAAATPGPVELEFSAGERRIQVSLARGELLGVFADGQRCLESECGLVLNELLELRSGTAVLRRGGEQGNQSSLGSLARILEAQAIHGVPRLPSRRGWRPKRLLSDSLARVAEAPFVREVQVQWRLLGPTGRNTVAMVSGMVTTGLLLLSLWPLLTPGPRGAAAPSAASSPIVAQTDVARVRQGALQGSTERAQLLEDAPPAARDSASLTDRAPSVFPSGCSRWINDKQPPLPQPHQAQAAWRMSRKAVQVGDLPKAEELLCVSVGMDPGGPGAEGLIRFHFSQNNIEAATNWAEWAARQKPNDVEVKQLLADVRSRQGRLDEARALLHSAMNVSAADVRVIHQVARKYTSAGYKALRALDPGQGERLLRRAVTLDDSNALAHAGLSEVSLRGGDLDAARKHAETSVRLDPACFEGQLALGDVYAESKQSESAKRAWLEAARLRPTSREARRRLGL